MGLEDWPSSCGVSIQLSTQWRWNNVGTVLHYALSLTSISTSCWKNFTSTGNWKWYCNENGIAANSGHLFIRYPWNVCRQGFYILTEYPIPVGCVCPLKIMGQYRFCNGLKMDDSRPKPGALLTYCRQKEPREHIFVYFPKRQIFLLIIKYIWVIHTRLTFPWGVFGFQSIIYVVSGVI